MASGRDDLYKMSVAVNFVQVPVRGERPSGKLVSGLTSNDFRVYEDGVAAAAQVFYR